MTSENTTTEEPQPRRSRTAAYGEVKEFDFNGVHYRFTTVDPDEAQGRWERPVSITRIEADYLDRTKGGWVQANSRADQKGTGTTITVKVL